MTLPELARMESLLSREIPPMRRARGYRLYSLKGKRFIDLWQEGGRAILGARPSGFTLVAKNLLAAGLYRVLPSSLEVRFPRTVARHFPGWKAFRVFRNAERALGALASLYPEEISREIDSIFALPDPARAGIGSGGLCGGRVSLFRPFIPSPEAEAAVPVLPVPASLSPALLLFREDPGESLRSDLCSPLQLACATKALSDLGFREKEASGDSWRETDGFLGEFFIRKGPYLSPRCAPEEYPGMFRLHLEAGILLSPRYDSPSILPGEWSEGDFRALRRAKI